MKKSISKVILVVVAIVFVGVLAMYGYKPANLTGIMDDGIRRGLDLVGGSSIVYRAVEEEGKESDDFDRDMEIVITMLRERVDNLGYTEATVAKYGDNSDMVLVEIPSINDPEQAVQQIGSTAELKFVDSNGKVVIEGKDVVNASAHYDDPNGSGIKQYFVSLEFNEAAREQFAAATEEMAALSSTGKNYITITLDDSVISQPNVDSKIDSTSCVITGNFTADEAMDLASLIAAGKLPFKLVEEELRAVGPSLGDKALETSLFAGAIGLVLVILFMIIMYRIPGIVSTISLFAYTAIFALVLVASKVNLSLPGIAGIILTIGMAVDANVVIYERIKEELALGKSIKAAVKAGFSRAIVAVIDSNVTTLIASIVLIIKGTGTVKGFGITLCIGVIVSMFTAVFVSKFLLDAFVNMNIKNPWLFGAAKKKAPAKEVTGGEK